MKSISFRDLHLIPELSGFNEIQLLHPHLDQLVNSFLADLAFDTDYPIEYVPSIHRDLQGVVALGFRAIGEVSINRNHINSPLCNLEDRLIAAGYMDSSLLEALGQLSLKSPDYSSLMSAEGLPWAPVYFYPPQNILEDDWENSEAQIRELYKIRDAVRGSAYNASGTLKMPDEVCCPQAG